MTGTEWVLEYMDNAMRDAAQGADVEYTSLDSLTDEEESQLTIDVDGELFDITVTKHKG